MAEKKNKAQLRLEAHQAKMLQFQEDIKNLGNPNDYTNKANYTGKVNELRKKYGVAGIGKDLNTYMAKLKREEGKLKKVVTSRYIKRAPVGLLERLLIDDYNNTGARYSDKNSLGYKINPDYVESLDPAGETQLKAKAEQKEALRIQKLEEQDRLRGSMTDSEMEMSEQGTWGPSPTWGVGNLNAGELLGNSKLTIEGNVSQDHEREVARDLNPNEVRTWSTDGGKETVYKDFKEFDEKDASGGKAKWLADTANSPAAKAGISDEMRWAARQNHLKWLKDKKNKKKLAITSPMDMD